MSRTKPPPQTQQATSWTLPSPRDRCGETFVRITGGEREIPKRGSKYKITQKSLLGLSSIQSQTNIHMTFAKALRIRTRFGLTLNRCFDTLLRYPLVFVQAKPRDATTDVIVALRLLRVATARVLGAGWRQCWHACWPWLMSHALGWVRAHWPRTIRKMGIGKFWGLDPSRF